MEGSLAKIRDRFKERGLIGLIFIVLNRFINLFYLAELKNKIGKENIGRNVYFDRSIEAKCRNIKIIFR